MQSDKITARLVLSRAVSGKRTGLHFCARADIIFYSFLHFLFWAALNLPHSWPGVCWPTTSRNVIRYFLLAYRMHFCDHLSCRLMLPGWLFIFVYLFILFFFFFTWSYVCTVSFLIGCLLLALSWTPHHLTLQALLHSRLSIPWLKNKC